MKKEIVDAFNASVSYIVRSPYELYMIVTTAISSFLVPYVNLYSAFVLFIVVTTLDTITRINADAVNKKLKFNPFKKYFWRQIKSDKLREMLNKVIMEYGIYFIICIVIDKLLFSESFVFDLYGKKLTLPVASLYLFSFIEIWSIGENIDDAGGVNLFKRIIHLLPEKIQKIVMPDAEEKDSENKG